MRTELAMCRYNATLLAERRGLLFVFADLTLVLVAFLAASLAGGHARLLYVVVVLAPIFLVMMPLLSGVVALERNAGSLDLALISPDVRRYFGRRIVPLCIAFVFQGWCVIVLLLDIDLGSALRAAVLSAAVVLFCGAVTLFWAVRVETAGSVLISSLFTVVVGAKWVFFVPITPKHILFPPPTFIGFSMDVWRWLGCVLALLFASVVLDRFTRLRWAKPETLLI